MKLGKRIILVITLFFNGLICYGSTQDLFEAIYKNQTERVCEILDTKNPDVNAYNKFGLTPLHLACLVNPQIALKLLDYDVDPRKPLNNGSEQKAIHLAAKRGSFALVYKLTSKNKSAVYEVDVNLNTPLHYAVLGVVKNLQSPQLDSRSVLESYQNIVSVLYHHYGFVTLPLNIFNRSPLHYAAMSKKYAICKHLLPQSCMKMMPMRYYWKNSLDNDQKSPLYYFSH